MKTFLNSALPCLIGAGIALATIHIYRAIWGHPKVFISASAFGICPIKYSKMYYRSFSSWITTCLMILGFMVGAGTAGYIRIPLERLGYAWCSTLIAGLTVALTIWITMRYEDRKIRDFITKHTPLDQKEREQDVAVNRQQ